MKSKTIILIIFLITNVFAQSELYKLRLANNKRNPINKLSLNYSYSNKNEEIQNHRYSFINLSGQAIVGSALAVGFTIIPLGALAANIFSRNSSDESQSVLVLVTISSYLLGAATGVHWIAKSENSELSYWETVGYSALGGVTSTIIASILASKYTTIPRAGTAVILLCPVVSSMIYASFISDWPKQSNNISFSNEIKTHQDLINSTNIFNFEIIKIKL